MQNSDAPEPLVIQVDQRDTIAGKGKHEEGQGQKQGGAKKKMNLDTKANPKQNIF